MSTDRGCHTSTMLDNGDIVVAGGTAARGEALSTTEIYRVNSLRVFSIAAISDAPNDEGGFVRIFWNAHPGDVTNSDAVSGYSVYVRDDVNGSALTGTSSGKWRMVGATDARSLRRYALSVPAPETSSSYVKRSREYVIAATAGSSILSVTSAASGSAFDNRGP